MKWLIDGHNLIGQMPNVQLNDPNDEEVLLAYLRRFRARTGHTLTVIFDSGAGYHPASKQKRGGITIQFVPSGQTADQALIRRIRKVRNPQEFGVITSDQAIVQVARQAGVRVTPAQEFARQLLNSGESSASAGDEKPDRSLSPNEVDEWLDIFNQTEK